MGMDVSIAPDMLRLKEVGDLEGIDIYPFKYYFQDFISKQSELEHKKD